MIIQFTAPLLDHSGYGEASRNTLMAMMEAGLKVTTKIVSFTADDLDVGRAGQMARQLEKKYQDFDINIIELTPEHFPIFIEPDKYNIGYFFWEVDGVDKKWIEWCNLMDEIWLPSPFFAKLFKKNGLKVPVRVIPCCMDMDLSKFKALRLPKELKSQLLYYSIFQWTERKNPQALIKVFLEEFDQNDQVALIVKTYRSNFTEPEKNAIKDEIQQIKNSIKKTNFPKIYLVLDDLSQEEIMRLHATGEIFVSPHRGEGWGYSQMAAAAFGNLIISTNFGGIHEFLPKDAALLQKFKLINVFGMGHIPWYNGTQKWAEINTSSLRKALRYGYQNQDKVKNIAKKAQKYTQKNFNYPVVGNLIKQSLRGVKKTGM